MSESLLARYRAALQTTVAQLSSAAEVARGMMPRTAGAIDLQVSAARATLEALERPTHRHTARGTTYVAVVPDALLQASSSPLDDAVTTVYWDPDADRVFARPTQEFDDGRFETL